MVDCLKFFSIFDKFVLILKIKLILTWSYLKALFNRIMKLSNVLKLIESTSLKLNTIAKSFPKSLLKFSTSDRSYDTSLFCSVKSPSSSLMSSYLIVGCSSASAAL
uniref:L1369 protein n=1 Tax=Saccharomyces cerevisiae TaxID=4932 RepID=E9PAB0_YEASX|nr:L1369 protein [Saccharomyces cerevisiae]